MKKYRTILIFILVIVIICLYAFHWSFYDMNRLPKGELIHQVESPNGQYTVKAYRTNGGATVAYAIRGELNYNSSNKKPKNIYWNYREESAFIEWVDNSTVIINDHKIDVTKEVYDYRRDK